jgi:hypothetical protein
MDARHAGAGSPRLVERARVADRQRSTLARCAALVLAALAVATLALAARADAYVYWTNYDPGTIGRANLDGTGVDQSFITGLGTFPLGVGVDDAHAYWTYWDTDTIGRANLDGTGVDPSFIAAPTSRGSQVAVDGAHVYWVSKYSDTAPGPPTSRLPAPARSGAPTSTARAPTRTSSAGSAFPLAAWRSTAPTSTGPATPNLSSSSLTDRFPARSGVRT